MIEKKKKLQDAQHSLLFPAINASGGSPREIINSQSQLQFIGPELVMANQRKTKGTCRISNDNKFQQTPGGIYGDKKKNPGNLTLVPHSGKNDKNFKSTINSNSKKMFSNEVDKKNNTLKLD